MQTALLNLQDIRVFQKLGRVDAKSLGTVDRLLLIFRDKPSAADFKKFRKATKYCRCCASTLRIRSRRSQPG